MLKVENVDVHGFEAAIRGMRNPMNSWDRIDTVGFDNNIPTIGKNDLGLMKRLASGGPVHGKYLRMIIVTADITAPLYWWKEADKYQVGTTTNSTSTMYKIHAKEFTLDDFSHEHLIGESKGTLNTVIFNLNYYRDEYIRTRDKKYWWYIIQLLPSSYNQRRTIQLNYEVIRQQYHYRKNHKLDEWHEYCAWAETLPYFKELFLDKEEENGKQ